MHTVHHAADGPYEYSFPSGGLVAPTRVPSSRPLVVPGGATPPAPTPTITATVNASHLIVVISDLGCSRRCRFVISKIGQHPACAIPLCAILPRRTMRARIRKCTGSRPRVLKTLQSRGDRQARG